MLIWCTEPITDTHIYTKLVGETQKGTNDGETVRQFGHRVDFLSNPVWMGERGKAEQVRRQWHWGASRLLQEHTRQDNRVQREKNANATHRLTGKYQHVIANKHWWGRRYNKRCQERGSDYGNKTLLFIKRQEISKCFINKGKCVDIVQCKQSQRHANDAHYHSWGGVGEWLCAILCSCLNKVGVKVSHTLQDRLRWGVYPHRVLLRSWWHAHKQRQSWVENTAAVFLAWDEIAYRSAASTTNH